MGKALFLRIAAGLSLSFGVIGAYYFLGLNGLLAASLLVGLLSVREFHRMIFFTPEARVTGILFVLTSLSMFLIHLFFKDWQVSALMSLLSIFLSLSIVFNRERTSNEELLKLLSLGLLGIFYCVLCPIFVGNMIFLEHGAWWFLFLLLIVFCGDTFAYFGGMLLGKHKLNPSISPKKTVEGAIAGTLGSLTASITFALYFYPENSVFIFALFGLACGVVGQTGDLLISLLKRVHNIKDSGRMIPGHGGVLDRVDSLLLACPLVYTFALVMH